jgi:hypothetical protein
MMILVVTAPPLHAAVITKIPASSSAGTHTLAARPTDTVHTVEIIKETEVGCWTFYGFEVDDGRSLAPHPGRPVHKITFYGDSNLAGYSLESEQNQSGQHLRGSYYGYAGIAVIENIKTRKGKVWLGFCVDEVSGDSLYYEPLLNVETCDSP